MYKLTVVFAYIGYMQKYMHAYTHICIHIHAQIYMHICIHTVSQPIYTVYVVALC